MIINFKKLVTLVFTLGMLFCVCTTIAPNILAANPTIKQISRSSSGDKTGTYRVSNISNTLSYSVSRDRTIRSGKGITQISYRISLTGKGAFAHNVSESQVESTMLAHFESYFEKSDESYENSGEIEESSDESSGESEEPREMTPEEIKDYYKYMNKQKSERSCILM